MSADDAEWVFFAVLAELREGRNLAGGAGSTGVIEETAMKKHITSSDMIYTNGRFTLCRHKYC